MLAFITTLRHPQNSVDYSRVEQLLLDTLNSVAQQSQGRQLHYESVGQIMLGLTPENVF